MVRAQANASNAEADHHDDNWTTPRRDRRVADREPDNSNRRPLAPHSCRGRTPPRDQPQPALRTTLPPARFNPSTSAGSGASRPTPSRITSPANDLSGPIPRPDRPRHKPGQPSYCTTIRPLRP